MAAELGLLSLNQLQKLAHQSQQNHHNNQHQHRPDPSLTAAGSSWMWNPKAQPQEDDDSWEVRAFAEDTGNVMGTTWPPRSYTCTFCRREFRSAQALGGHMNVHRRDRARLHQAQPGGAINPTSPSPTTSSSTLLIPTQEFATNGGLCLLYQLPNPNGVFTSLPMSACSIESPSTLLSISPYSSSNLVAAPSISFPVTPPPGLNINNSSALCYSSKAEPSTTTSADNINNIGNASSGDNNNNNNCKETSIEDLDLELRLGHRPTSS